MLAQKNDTENVSAVMCIARRIASNEICNETPIDSFTTQVGARFYFEQIVRRVGGRPLPIILQKLLVVFQCIFIIV